jgi:hypothetical protein
LGGPKLTTETAIQTEESLKDGCHAELAKEGRVTGPAEGRFLLLLLRSIFELEWSVVCVSVNARKDKVYLCESVELWESLSVEPFVRIYYGSFADPSIFRVGEKPSAGLFVGPP